MGKLLMGTKTSNVEFQIIHPGCGLIAMKMPEIMLVYDTYTVHFTISATKQKELIGAIKLVLAVLNSQATMPANTAHAIIPRIGELANTLNRFELHISDWEDFGAATKSQAKIVAEYPMMPDTLSDEVAMVNYLCTNYKISCGNNRVTGTVVFDENTIHHDVAMLERILNELEDFNFGAISDRDVIKWAIEELPGWQTVVGMCDLTYKYYNHSLEKILESYDGLLGSTITLPCLTDEQVYDSYSIFTAPVRIKDKIWKVVFDKEIMIVINKESRNALMIHPTEDVQVMYHADKKLPYLDGNGMNSQRVPNYIKALLPGTEVSTPETCPLTELSSLSHYSQVHLTAYGPDKWLSINFRGETTTLQYSKRTSSLQITMPTGISVITTASKVRIRPSMLTFITNRRWRNIATEIFYNEVNYNIMDLAAITGNVTLISTPMDPNRVNDWLVENIGITLEAALSASIVSCVLAAGLCAGSYKTIRKCGNVHKKRKLIRKSIPRAVKHSAAVLKAVNPFLTKEEVIPELW
jgi:hypothetical protein